MRGRLTVKRASLDVINGWQDGKSYPNVDFTQSESAVVVTKGGAEITVTVITLEALEPEPHYLVEREDGSSFIARQSELKKVVRSQTGCDLEHEMDKPFQFDYAQTVRVDVSAPAFLMPGSCVAVVGMTRLSGKREVARKDLRTRC
jgi:hypothetical protein